MQILIIVVAAAAGVPLGLWMRHNLATLGYRDEDERDLPQPGPRWWVVWTSILSLASLGVAASLSGRPVAYLPLLPLAVTGPWLAAVDFDVLRISNRVLAPTVVATFLALGAVAVAAQAWKTLVVPVIAALVLGGVFAAVHFATRGAIGFGDVKLAAGIGLAVEPVGVGTVWLGIAVGSLAAFVWAKATGRVDPIPYGPWLLCGAWITALAGSAIGA